MVLAPVYFLSVFLLLVRIVENLLIPVRDFDDLFVDLVIYTVRLVKLISLIVLICSRFDSIGRMDQYEPQFAGLPQSNVARTRIPRPCTHETL